MDLSRLGAAGALVAAAAWTVSGLVAFLSPGSNFGPVGSQSWYLIESSDATAEAGMLVALVGIHARQASHYGRLGRVGFIIAFAGTAFVLASTVLWLLAGGAEGPLTNLLFIAAVPFVFFGFPLVGVAILKNGVLPRWSGWLLLAWILYFPAIQFLVGNFGEVRILLGLVWLAMAWALWRRDAEQG